MVSKHARQTVYRFDVLDLAEDVLGCRLVRLQEVVVVAAEEDRPRPEAEAAEAEEAAPALYIAKLNRQSFISE